ncbi:Glycosyltransferase family 4 protein [Vibrio chagasii]|nr:Glycosyltransferase family 4 protein [Vibrio chagasii]CAH6867811.1 Glycosyltransferase family 4 protein [Vibrio chagasii]CAH7051800.1 Glycosyltransferase family 4 protein [Vibrio chagasii]CAH7112838.1 Glycosyltransferase family 4 protein [Vibrio chagasii]CAH7303156.1 Glycosyltransferase family 4 protein [Vibrio chagasii]
MNKIVVVGSDPRLIGGAETFSRTLIDIFDNIYFVSLYRDVENQIFDVENVHTVFDKSLLGRLINKLSKGLFPSYIMKRFIENINPNVVILNSPLYYPTVRNVENIILRQHTCTEMFWEMRVQFNRDESLLSEVKENSHVVALSPQEKYLLVNEMGFLPEKVSIIRNSCKIPRVNFEKVSGNKLVMINRFDNEIKRMDLAINAMSLLPDYELHIYGSGKDYEYIVEISKPHSNVYIHKSTNDVVAVLDSSSILINCSEFEGYPITCIEACRRGLPVLVRNTFSSAQDIVDGNGVILERHWNPTSFADAVIHISGNYSAMSRRSIYLSSRFDPEVINKEWSDLVNRIS